MGGVFVDIDFPELLFVSLLVGVKNRRFTQSRIGGLMDGG